MHNRVSNHPILCHLRLYFAGSFQLLKLSGAPPVKDKRFYESVHEGEYNPSDPYFSSGSFNFSESYSETEAGGIYKQQASFRFPSNDQLRSQRIESFRKVKFLGLHLSDGSELIMGRNDIVQNRPPSIQINSGIHLTEVKLSTESILPVLRIYREGSGGTLRFGYDYTYNFDLS